MNKIINQKNEKFENKDQLSEFQKALLKPPVFKEDRSKNSDFNEKNVHFLKKFRREKIILSEEQLEILKREDEKDEEENNKRLIEIKKEEIIKKENLEKMKEIEKNRKAFLEMKDDYDYNNIYNLYGYKINNLDDILIF